MSSTKAQRFVVLGVGAMGPVVVRDLGASSPAHQITIADLDGARANALATQLPRKRFKARRVNVEDRRALVKLLRGHDVVINCTPYVKNVAVMEGALEAGVHYLDLGGLYHETRRQLQLDSRFRRAKLLAVLGMGGAPGITNVMARYAAERLERLEEIKIQVASVLKGEMTNAFVIPYSLATILDEFTKAPVVFSQGKVNEVEPLSGREVITFPEPVGTVEAVYALHSELATLPGSYKSKGLREVSFRVAFPAAFFERLRLLIALGFAQSEPVSINGIRLVPREFLSRLVARLPRDEKLLASYGVLRVEVHGRHQRQPIRYTLELLRSPRTAYPGASPTAITTALPAAIVAQMIASGKMEDRGVLPPELCVEPEPFFAELARRGLNVQVTTQVGATPPWLPR
jgi:saccharopine dehydrogenase-like NADP-dependent oxidoreductase